MQASPSSFPLPITSNMDVEATINGYRWVFSGTGSKVLTWSTSGSLWNHPTLQSAENLQDFDSLFSNIDFYIDVDFQGLGYFGTDQAGTGYAHAAAAGSNLNISFAYEGYNAVGAWVDDGGFNALSETAFCNFPRASVDSSLYWGASGDTWMNLNNLFIAGLNFEPGTAGYALVLHEVLHGLGLKHPHDDGGTGRPTYTDLGVPFADRQWLSVMSYDRLDSGGDGAYDGSMPISPMVMDVLGLQYLYGESHEAAGNTVHDMARYLGNFYNTLWDSSGVDTIDASTVRYGVYVDLGSTQASNGHADHNVGFVTTTIDKLSLDILGYNPTKWTWLWGEYENFNGSAYDDHVTGNAFDNDLNGGNGNDYIEGGAGNDRFDWDSTMRGGADTFVGGPGDDAYVLDSIFDVVVERDLEGVDTVNVGFDYSLVGRALENLIAFNDLRYGLTLTGNDWGNLIRGGPGADVLMGLEGADSLYGESGADRLMGDRGDDILHGGAGADQLWGGAGSDTYYVDNLGDAVIEVDGQIASGGNDTVYSSLINYVLPANVEVAIANSVGMANLTGNGLDNLLVAGVGANILDGGSGVDTVDYRSATARVFVNLSISTPQATGGSGVDVLRNVENLTGSNFDDILTGDARANRLDGGNGRDTLAGGDGSDVYIVDSSGDVVQELNANTAVGGDDTVYSSLSIYTLPANVERGRITASGAANLNGNAMANTLTAGTGNNVLDGGAGLDTADYSLASGSVTLSLALGGNQFTGASGYDMLVSIENLTGSSYADRLIGSSAGNVLNGGAGADVLSGADGSDVYFVDHAADLVVETNPVRGSGGTDTVYSALASYTLPANVENGVVNSASASTLNGNALDNLLVAGAGNNVLDGGAGYDTVEYGNAAAAVSVNLGLVGVQATGGSGLDRLIGIEGLGGSRFDDVLVGNQLANQLQGGAGSDRLTGGAGADVFVLSSRQGSDTVTDFQTGVDKLRVSIAGLPVGDQDAMVEGAVLVAAGTRFATSAEVVAVSTDILGGITPEAAAAIIGQAAAPYRIGDARVFLVDNGQSSGVFWFSSGDTDALVEPSELVLLATLQGTPALALGDLMLGS